MSLCPEIYSWVLLFLQLLRMCPLEDDGASRVNILSLGYDYVLLGRIESLRVGLGSSGAERGESEREREREGEGR